MTANILVILAHPDLSKSKNNAALKEAVAGLPNVTVHELYKQYPDGKINVAHEQMLLQKADVVVLQFPFYWYSSPPLLKAWEDQVLAYGFAYGDKYLLEGKQLLVAITTYGPADAYQPGGFNNFTLDTLLTPFHQTANFCKMKFAPHFAINDVSKLTGEQLAAKASEYHKLLRDWKN
ncbi:MAG: NAD(P)H-dependent oxidoreductase [Candidatus Micrarchaeota archaeon]|nr:NAD(P)H-dependent oxidoreductase [Candidatus Micrarchaeota archaeon]